MPVITVVLLIAGAGLIGCDKIVSLDSLQGQGAFPCRERSDCARGYVCVDEACVSEDTANSSGGTHGASGGSAQSNGGAIAGAMSAAGGSLASGGIEDSPGGMESQAGTDQMGGGSAGGTNGPPNGCEPMPVATPVCAEFSAPPGTLGQEFFFCQSPTSMPDALANYALAQFLCRFAANPPESECLQADDTISLARIEDARSHLWVQGLGGAYFPGIEEWWFALQYSDETEQWSWSGLTDTVPLGTDAASLAAALTRIGETIPPEMSADEGAPFGRCGVVKLGSWGLANDCNVAKPFICQRRPAEFNSPPIEPGGNNTTGQPGDPDVVQGRGGLDEPLPMAGSDSAMGGWNRFHGGGLNNGGTMDDQEEGGDSPGDQNESFAQPESMSVVFDEANCGSFISSGLLTVNPEACRTVSQNIILCEAAVDYGQATLACGCLLSERTRGRYNLHDPLISQALNLGSRPDEYFWVHGALSEESGRIVFANLERDHFPLSNESDWSTDRSERPCLVMNAPENGLRTPAFRIEECTSRQAGFLCALPPEGP